MADDYEAFEFLEKEYRQEKKNLRRRLRDLDDPFDMEDEDFRKEYRLSKGLVDNLCEELKPLMGTNPRKSTDLTIQTKFCEAVMQIISVDASHLGANHDSFIWTNHPLRVHLDDLSRTEPLWLLGDSGYPLRSTMMTPILNAEPESPEAHYTALHVSARNIIERTIGILKARFRCLLVHRVLHYQPQVAGSITNACVILHNICNAANTPVPELSPRQVQREALMQNQMVPYSEPSRRQNMELQVGIATRRDLVNRLWDLRRHAV